MPATASPAASSRNRFRRSPNLGFLTLNPQPRRIEPKFALLGAGVVAMILYGSLFPFASIFAGAFRGIVPLIGVLFALHVCINALLPFQFLSQPRPFGWTPFLSLLMASRESAVRAFFEKAFMYGALVWLLVRAGWKMGRNCGGRGNGAGATAGPNQSSGALGRDHGHDHGVGPGGSSASGRESLEACGNTFLRHLHAAATNR